MKQTTLFRDLKNYFLSEYGGGSMMLPILIFVMGLFISLSFLFYGYNKTWRLWNIPVMSQSFADMRAITGGAESFDQGHDPLFENPRDPWNRPMNYPRIWQSAFALGIDQSHTKYIGGFLAAFFFLDILIAFCNVDKVTAVFLSVVVFSPAVLLGLERGNTDLFIFFLLSLGLLIGQISTILALSIILLAAILKLYPIMGLSYLLRESRRDFLLLLKASLSLFGLYLAFTFEDVLQVLRVTPRVTHISYGMNVFWMLVRSRNEQVGSIVAILSYFASAFVIISALFLKLGNHITTGTQDNKFIDAFRIGALIYVGIFLYGNSWDYRLMFLIFTIPQLVAWARREETWLSRLAKVTLGAIVIACWFFVISRVLSELSMSPGIDVFIDELSLWVVFVGLTYLFTSSLPDWFIWPRGSLLRKGV
jgi:hypothetical protein